MGIFNRGSDRANDSARRPAVPMNMSSNGAPPALGERRSTLSDVPLRSMSDGVMSPTDVASEKQKGWASFQSKEYGNVTKPDTPMGAATRSNLENYGGYNGPAGNVK
jgi:hypothetical protein